MTAYILIRKAIMENAETRHGTVIFKPGEAIAIMDAIFFPMERYIHGNFSGLFLEEITESQFETYELFGFPSLCWENVTSRRDDFNSHILLARIEKVLKRNGVLT